jgi:hypothetical protein
MSEFSGDEIRVLKQLAAGLLGATGGNGGGASGKAAGDKILDADWCQRKTVDKLPKNWDGSNIIGMRWEECASEDLLKLAGFYEWKAEKGRNEVPVRLNNKGEPWHKSDTFNAEICRGYAKRNQGKKPGAKPAGRQPEYPAAPSYSAPEYGTDPSEDGSDLPF